MESLPPASHPAGDGRRPDTRSSSFRLPLAWGILLPGKARTSKDLGVEGAWETFGVWFFLVASE